MGVLLGESMGFTPAFMQRAHTHTFVHSHPQELMQTCTHARDIHIICVHSLDRSQEDAMGLFE